MDARRRRWIVPAAATALLLGVGVITYFTGGAEPADTAASTVRVDPDVSRTSVLVPKTLVRLPWSDGPTGASRKGSPSRSTIEAAFTSGGMTVVADHPSDVIGARVRWFGADGGLVGSHLAPSGSTNFGPAPGGFHYVVAKSGRPSEGAVVVSFATAQAVGYTVPLGLNSGPLYWRDDDLYASIIRNDVDLPNEKVTTRGMLVPVARAGAQVSDGDADRSARAGWGVTSEGRVYRVTTRVDGVTTTVSRSETVLQVGAERLEIPLGRRVLGVTGRLVYMLAGVRAPSEYDRQVLAGWTDSAEPVVDLMVSDLSGRIRYVAAIPRSGVVDRAEEDADVAPVMVCGSQVVAVVESQGGVSVVAYADR